MLKIASLSLSLQFLNGVMPLVILSLLGESVDFELYIKGGAAYGAMNSLVIGALSLEAFSLFYPWYLLRRYVLSRSVASQRMLDRMYEPPEFSLAEHYARVLKIFGMTVCFAPLSPLVISLIGAFGLTVSWLLDRYVAFKHAKKPHNVTLQAQESFYRVLWAIAFVSHFLAVNLLFKDVTPAFALFFVSYSFVGIIICCVPYRAFDRLARLVPRYRKELYLADSAKGLPFTDALVAANKGYVDGEGGLSDESAEEEENQQDNPYYEVAPGLARSVIEKFVYAPPPPVNYVYPETLQAYRDSYTLFDEPVSPNSQGGDNQQ